MLSTGVRDSLSSILAEREDACRGALQQVHEAVAQAGPDSVWLKNHDAYIASQLRAAAAPKAVLPQVLYVGAEDFLLRGAAALDA